MCRMQQLEAVFGLGWRQRMVKCSLPTGVGSPELGVGLMLPVGLSPMPAQPVTPWEAEAEPIFYSQIKM